MTVIQSVIITRKWMGQKQVQHRATWIKYIQLPRFEILHLSIFLFFPAKLQAVTWDLIPIYLFFRLLGLLGEPSRSVSGLIFPSILPTLDAVSIIALGLLNSKAVFWIIQVCTYSVNLVEWYTEIVDDLVINVCS